MPGQRLALIIANSHFAHLGALPGAAQDAKELKSVLSDPKLGQFEVKMVPDKSHYEIISEIEDFVSNRSPDDFLLIHYSGHGLKDASRKLYFAGTNTAPKKLISTGIPSTTINELLTKSRPNKIVLLLDCCYGGAFFSNHSARAADHNEIRVLDDFSQGKGLVVLSASNEAQYAFEGNAISGTATSAVFTSILVHGIRSGEADSDKDGLIDITELYDYVSKRVVKQRPEQTPVTNTLKGEGKIFIARSHNLWTQIKLTWEEAELGGERNIVVGKHKRTIDIPSGVTNDFQKTYSGQGLIPGHNESSGQIAMGESSPGDLVVSFIVAPKKLEKRVWITAIGATGLLVTIMLFLVFWLPKQPPPPPFGPTPTPTKTQNPAPIVVGNPILAEKAMQAITNPNFERNRGLPLRFVRQVIGSVYGSKYDRYRSTTCTQSARLFQSGGLARSHTKIGDLLLGDVLFQTQDQFGNTGIYIGNNLVVSNNATATGRIVGAVGINSLTQFGKIDLVVSLPPPKDGDH